MKNNTAIIVLGIAVLGAAALIIIPFIPNLQEAPPSRASETESDLLGMSFALVSPTAVQVGGVDIVERAEGGIDVRVLLGSVTAGGERPAHLHTGSCVNLGAIVFPLNPVIEGSSKTTLSVSANEFQAQLPLVVNVHESAEQLDVTLACGAVPTP